MHRLELRIPPLALVVLFCAAQAGTAHLLPQATFTLPGANLVAAALLLAGTAVAVAGVIAFRRHGTTVNPLTPEASSAIVRSGVYARTRNPMYLGFLLWLAALAVWLENAAAAAWLPAFVAYLNRFQIAPEERALRERFGEEFARYTAGVRRWI